jgi:hypothetical protein
MKIEWCAGTACDQLRLPPVLDVAALLAPAALLPLLALALLILWRQTGSLVRRTDAVARRLAGLLLFDENVHLPLQVLRAKSQLSDGVLLLCHTCAQRRGVGRRRHSLFSGGG